MLEYAALDLETTGLDPERDRIIEIGAVAFTQDVVLDRIECLVEPGRSVPDTVLRLTGIEPTELAGASPAPAVLERLARLLQGRQPVGHGASLDVDFLVAAGLWDASVELIDTLHIARILLPNAPSHSLPLLAAELGLQQPRPHRAFDDADATRQLFLRLREEAASLPEALKEAMLALVAPYGWPVARFFADALTGPQPASAADDLVTADTTVLRGGAGRASTAVTDDPAGLAALLDPGGPLATSLPDYELRESQRQMLLAVSQVFKRGGTLVVEAGTGTGKSLAYLIPAIARARSHGERVVVSTNTHTLQEQLIGKDLPALREWLPWEFTACLLKGRANYLSLRRWRRYLAEVCKDAEELRFKLKVLVWLNQTGTGDRSELRLHGGEEVLWARIASDPMDCVGVFCTAADCYVHRARAEAEKADLVVVNHALLLADAAQGGGILPPYEHLIVDEAHHLEDAATQGLRCEVDGPGLAALLERLASPDERLIGEVRRHPRLGAGEGLLSAAPELAAGARKRVDALFSSAGDWVRAQLADVGRRDESVRLNPVTMQAPGAETLRDLAGDAVTALAALDGTVRGAVAACREWLGGEQPDQALRELEIIRGRLAEAQNLVREALLEPDQNRVYWFTLLARSSVLILRSAPLNVGELLREHVLQQLSTAVFTSASLTVGDSFDYFRQRVGLLREPHTLSLASPFDYLEQALVCLPAGIPDPQDPEFDALVVEVLAEVARRIGGRTLALFTSHRQLRDTYYALKQRPDLDEVLILGQGLDGQRRQVLKSFVENERPLLLGTASFWEGIDVPGDRLSCVVMVRLPFPVPTDPVFAARAEQVRDSFEHYALPLAALRLKQGFGRLIRRSSDRGAVVILDNRISSRDYGRAFLEVLPPASTFRGPVDAVPAKVEEWVTAGARAAR